MGEPVTGEVFLIGAGPGDIELITLKAVRVLKQADVILLDNLVNRDILNYVREGVTVIQVGKRGGKASCSQEEINTLLVQHAKSGKTVARVKGGDPFVFGRGGEEMEALAAEGIKVTVIPGITSGTAVPGALQIPLTHRHLAQSVVFVTGSTREGGKEPNWAALASSESTIVIYMGLTHIGTIAEKLIAGGLRDDTPSAAVQNGTLPQEVALLGPLTELVKDVELHHLESPTIFIIGEVVKTSPLWTRRRELIKKESS
jgi:uroporphyrin-III C-methyltransferase